MSRRRFRDHSGSVPDGTGLGCGHDAPVNDFSTQTRGAPVPSERPWRLIRAEDGKLAGVCAGLAASSGVDVTLVRIAFVLAGLSGFGVIAYIVLAVVVPKQERLAGEALVAAPADTARWIRIALGGGAAVGLIGMLDAGPPFFDGPDDAGGFMLGLVLCGIGALILWNRRDRGASQTPSSPAWSPSTTPPPASPSSAWAPPAPAATGASGEWTMPVEHAPVTEPTSVRPHMPAPPPPMPGSGTVPAVGPAPFPAARQRLGASAVIARVIAWLVVLFSVVVMVAVVAVVRVDALSVPWPWVFLGLAIAGVVQLIVWASVARSAAPVAVSIAALLVLGGVLAGASHWNGEIGERFDTPTARAAAAEPYELAIGHQVIDLSELDISGDPIRLTADVKIGQLEVVVPDGVTVDVSASATAGSIELFGEERDGWNTDFDVTDGSDDQRRYLLDIEVGYGRIDVCRAADAEVVGDHLECNQAAS